MTVIYLSFISIFSLGNPDLSISRAKKLIKKDPDAAITMLNQLLTEGALTRVDQGRCQYLLGRAYESGADTIAVSYYHRALRIYDDLSDKKEQAKVLYRIGVFYAIHHKPEKAKLYFKRCWPIYEELGNTKRLAALKISLSNVAYEMHEYERARLGYLELLRDSVVKATPGYLSDLHNNLASVYKKERKFDSASFIYKSAIRRYRDEHDTSRLVGAYHNLGSLYVEVHEVDSAHKYLSKSLEYAKARNQLTNIKKAYFQMSRVFQASRNYEQALTTYLVYDSLEKIDNNSEVKARVEEIATKYQTEQKEQRIALQQAEIKTQRTRMSGLLITLIVALLLTLIIIVFYRQREKVQAELREKSKAISDQEIDNLLKEQELKVLSASLDGQEKERKRIAEDLHDRLGSMLAAVKLYFSSITLNDSNEKRITEATKILDDTIEETRRIAHDLTSSVLAKFGLVPALQNLKDTIDKTDKIKVEVYTENLDQRLSNDLEVNLYRIIQEAVSNVLKHANAANITLQLTQHEDNQVTLMIEDDGNGFELLRTIDNAGIGIENMKARVAKFDGELALDSRVGKGTTIIVQIPNIHPI